jgi:hypothetical protein
LALMGASTLAFAEHAEQKCGHHRHNDASDYYLRLDCHRPCFCIGSTLHESVF